MRSRAFLPLFFLVAFTNQALAQDASKPWWNPFAKSESTVTTASATSPVSSDAGQVRDSTFFNGKDSEPLIKLPKLTWFGAGKKTVGSPSSTKKTSMLTKAGKTTKRWWGKTVDLINPFDSKSSGKDKAAFFQQQGYQPQNVKRESKGPLSWLWQEQTVETPHNVNDFLRQPRPRF